MQRILTFLFWVLTTFSNPTNALQDNTTLPNSVVPLPSSNSTLNHPLVGGLLIPWAIVSLGVAGWIFYDFHLHRKEGYRRLYPENEIEMTEFGPPSDAISEIAVKAPLFKQLVVRRVMTSLLLVGDAFGTAVAAGFLGGVARLLPESPSQTSFITMSYVCDVLTACFIGLAGTGPFSDIVPKTRAGTALNYIAIPATLSLFGLATFFAIATFFDAAKYTEKPTEIM